ncbi:lysoplasmalogenase [Mycolicibacterium mucogenicum]|uniref:lysoplasmalogenase n=1 Tax=Mycolicibacterium mucogenicum TaxID=56689 RepID=UPI00226A6B9F|nr:lysoplasmalogenase [Mycolicibacterium mucogenicum]MCX8561753.1 lysoplasmalogenase [Mycolicibacterium mucogenicum]
MRSPYAVRRWLWIAAAVVAAGYGIFLIATALRLPSGADLTGQFVLQPAIKALPALLLAVAAAGHAIVRERNWLVAALVFSAGGDFLLAVPGWPMGFVFGLGSFLIAHLCFLAALLPLARRTPAATAGAAVLVVICVGLVVWFWPSLVAQQMTIPVTVYMAVLVAMVCTALFADLPTHWTALGALCFAVSDGMIGISKFVLGDERLAVPIWWAYAASLLLITAGFFADRTVSTVSAVSATPTA